MSKQGTNGLHRADASVLAVSADDPTTPRSSIPGWDDELLDDIARAYGIGAPQDCEVLETSRDKRLLLTAGGREYLIRAVSGQTCGPLAIEAELDLVEYLWSKHFPVAKLVRTSADARYLSIRGDHYLMTVVENAQPYDPANRAHRVEAGTGLAQFHELAKDFAGASPLGSAPYLNDLVEQRTDWIEASTHRPADAMVWGRSNHLKRALLNAREELLNLLSGITEAYAGEQPVLIHGAYDRLALSFDALGLAEVGNLDQVGYDIRLADLARSLLSFCTVQEGDDVSCADLDPAVLAEFLAAYEQVSPLSPLELDTLPYFLRAIHLAKVVDDCRRLLTAPIENDEARIREREAGCLCLALQLGPVSRGPHMEETN